MKDGEGSARSLSTRLVAGIAGFAARRARLLVVAWVLLFLVLAFLGRNLEKQLAISPPFVAGSDAARAHEIAQRQFDGGYAVIVMLRGPVAAVERQGRELEARLAEDPDTLVVSPWTDEAKVDGLSPRPGVAALVVRVTGEGGDEVRELLPPLRGEIEATVAPPVRSSMAGAPVVVDSFSKASKSAIKLGELVALPVLLLVLLIAFRSVVAAAIPLVMGAMVVTATRGVLSMLVGVVELDLLVLGITGMLGLALGVDYSLLVVSRFREERERRGQAEAVEATVRASANSIGPAGCALVLAMLVAPLVLPSGLIRSAATGVIVATLLSMLVAVCVVPALLMLLDRHLDRWSLAPRRAAPASLRWSRRLIQRPAAVLALVFGMVLLSTLSFGLDSGIGSAQLLPASDRGRQDQEAVEETLGPGWAAPLEVVVSGRKAPVTSIPRLRAIAAFQRKVEDDPGVASMAGLAAVASGAEDVAGIEGQLAGQERGLDRLESGLGRLGDGAEASVEGLSRAARGSSSLDGALGAANAGAAALAGGLEQTSAGSDRLTQGLGQAGEGSSALAQGARKTSAGAGRLNEGIARAREGTSEVHDTARLFRNAMRSGEARLGELHSPLSATEAQLAAAWQALQRMTAGRADPQYAAALAAVEEATRRLTGTDPGGGEAVDPSYGGVEEGIERAESEFEVGLYLTDRLEQSGRDASKGLAKLERGSTRIDRGLDRLAAASQQVSDGVSGLARGGEELSPALRRLSLGAASLAGGLGRLQEGSGRLAEGLGEGAASAEALPRSLRRIGTALRDQRGGGDEGSRFDQLRGRSPGIFRSAYFVLAALDGSQPLQRQQLSTLLNLDRGGMNARLLVVPRHEPTSSQAGGTVERVEEKADELARKTGMEVVVGGPAVIGTDLDESLRDQAPAMRLALALISLVVLIPLMRSLIVPVLAALVNLLTLSATFGILALLFNGSLLGGPGYVDGTIIPATMIVIFGLAIDYEVFVFARIREEYVRTGSTSAAVVNGMDRTGPVVTGAAVIMITVFLAFALSDFVNIRNFGVAQAIAVFIDAFIVRLVLVPATIGWLGDRVWWMPRWLSRSRTPS